MSLFVRRKKLAYKVTLAEVTQVFELYQTKGIGKRPVNEGKLRQAITIDPERTVESTGITYPPKISIHGGGAWCNMIASSDGVAFYYTENSSLANKPPLTEREDDIRIITEAFYDFYHCWGLPDTLKEPTPKDSVMEEIQIRTFDASEPPLLQLLDNGKMYLIFEGFPPENEKLTTEQCEAFEKILSEYIGVPVTHDDRELFVVDDNSKITAKRVVEFFEQLG